MSAPGGTYARVTLATELQVCNSSPRNASGRIADVMNSPQSDSLELSVVAPAFEELENVRPLATAVRDALRGIAWQLILVDDGSRDGTAQVIAELVHEDPRIVGVFHGTNLGQTSALASGIDRAEAPLIATLDADLQNDPRDLLRLLERIHDADAVVGYRERRNDDWLRRLSSRVGNRIRDWVTGDSVRDTGCALKLFRAEAIRSVALFEGMHRFLPTLVRWNGYRVLEVAVSHHPRVAGRSKYGVRNRAWRAAKDLLAVRWMRARLVPRGRGVLLAARRTG